MSLTRARELRNGATPIERRLWTILKPLREQGYHFRRQVPIGPYYADVACHHAKLVIEADGITHVDQAYDRRRDDFMRAQGFVVLRVSNSDIVTNPNGVLLAIEKCVKGIEPLALAPMPSPRGPRKRELRSGLNDLAARTGAEVPPPPSPLRGGVGGGGRDHWTSEKQS